MNAKVKKQSRRTVSISGPLYWAFRAQCIISGQAQALVVDRLLRRWLRNLGAPEEAPRPPDDEVHGKGEARGHAAHFTF